MSNEPVKFKEEVLSMLESEAEADLKKAELSFKLLTEKAVGVGHHATEDFWNDARKMLDVYADAKDRLEAIQNLANLD